MLTLGIDMGSNTVKAVALRDGLSVLSSSVLKTSHDLDGVTRACVLACLDDAGLTLEQCDNIVATGYGRVTCTLTDTEVSEISCHGRGAHFLFPSARSVIDIGGQDSKVILLSDAGKVVDFVMNDKCAAGTGRFLEVMAQALGVPLDDFGAVSACSKNPVGISNTCTVFAESEVIGLMARKQPKEDIIAGLHASIASRVAALANRLRIRDDVVLTGGVALNGGMRAALEKEMGRKLLAPSAPQIIGALGAAIIAANTGG